MAWIRQKQCLNCGETYDIDVKICPHCNVESKDIFQNKYWEQTIWYKMVDCRILTQKELEKIHRRKNKRIRYDENWFDPRTWLYRDGSRYTYGVPAAPCDQCTRMAFNFNYACIGQRIQLTNYKCWCIRGI